MSEQVYKVRNLLQKEGWIMVGHFSGEYWSNGSKRLCLTKDSVFTFTQPQIIIPIDKFIESEGKGIIA